MADQGDDRWSAFIKGALVVGGVLIGAKLLEQILRHPCPVCGYGVVEDTPQCPNCRSRLVWSGRR
jgi:hypothetical protein